MTTITPESIYQTLKKENPTSIIFLQTYDNEWGFVKCKDVTEFRKFMCDIDCEMGEWVDCSEMFLTITWERGSHYSTVQFFDKDDYKLFTEDGLYTKHMSMEDKAEAFEELLGFLSDQYDVVEHIWDGIKDIANGEGRMKREKQKLEKIGLEKKKLEKEKLEKEKRSEEWDKRQIEKKKEWEEERRMANRPVIKPFEFPDINTVMDKMIE